MKRVFNVSKKYVLSCSIRIESFLTYFDTLGEILAEVKFKVGNVYIRAAILAALVYTKIGGFNIMTQIPIYLPNCKFRDSEKFRALHAS